MIDQKLTTLLAVCETGSYTAAAQRLSLTQPAVSQHIKQLEGELGARIFTRSEGELKLTAEGKTAVKFARKITAMYAGVQKELEDERRSIRRVTVGITHTSESNPVAEMLAQYCREHEGVRIKLISDSVKNLYKKLRDYQLDLAVVEGRPADGEFNTLLLDTDSLMLAVAKDSPLAESGVVTTDELQQQPLILRLPESNTRNLFVSHLESRGMSIKDFNVILEVDNIATIKDLIRRGFGVSILPKSACLDELKKGKLTLLPVENLSMSREINIVYRSDFEHPELLRDLRDTYNATLSSYR